MPTPSAAPPFDPLGNTAHVVLPWAVSLLDDCQTALPQLDDAQAFPHWHRLLARLNPTQKLEGDEYAQSTPHERIWAQAMGWPHAAGDQIPWAAQLARQDGLVTGTQAWGLLTPCHWAMGHDHLTLIHPDELALQEAESRQLLAAIAPLFVDEGWGITWGACTRWYVQHESLADLPTASLDRVLGRNPDLWMPEHPGARMIKRLQAEVQMLLYEHPINDTRQARGSDPVNSFWLSGCGRWPAGSPDTAPLISLDAPRAALMRGDVAAWLAAWRALEHSTWPALLARLDAGLPLTLTLCGERHAVSLTAAGPSPWWQRAWQATAGRWHRPPALPSALLASL